MTDSFAPLSCPLSEKVNGNLDIGLGKQAWWRWREGGEALSVGGLNTKKSV